MDENSRRLKEKEIEEAKLEEERKKKNYNPGKDAMMPRLFRKISHQMGSTGRSNMTSMSKGGSLDWAKVSTYDNNESISKIGSGEKYTLVHHPLRTKSSKRPEWWR